MKHQNSVKWLQTGIAGMIILFLAVACLHTKQAPSKVEKYAKEEGISLPSYPWHLMRVSWDVPEAIDNFERFDIEVSIDRDISEEYNLYISPIGGVALNDMEFYGGMQTNVNGQKSGDEPEVVYLGKGGIFSRWSSDGKPVGLEYTDKKSDGLCASNGSEGEFCSIRRPFHWTAGTYTFSLIKDEIINFKGQPHTWFKVAFTNQKDASVVEIGRLLFEGEQFRFGRRFTAFVEVYSTEKIPSSDIPEANITFGYPRINGNDIGEGQIYGHYATTGLAASPNCADVSFDGRNVTVTIGPKVRPLPENEIVILRGQANSHNAIGNQVADEKATELMGRRDFFELNRLYAIQKDSLSDYMRLFSGALVHTFFNRPDSAIPDLMDLVNQFQDRLSPSDVPYMILLMCQNHADRGHYSDAAAIAQSFLSQAGDQLDAPYRQSWEALYHRYHVLSQLPATTWSRPGRDCTIPLVITKVGTDLLMRIPVMVQGKEARFIFSTGTTLSRVSETFAREHNIRIVADSVVLDQGYLKMGMVDSMRIGNINIRNAYLYITPDSPGDTLSKYMDAIIGVSFMRQLKEAHLYPNKRVVVFPAKETIRPEAGSNLMFSQTQLPYVEVTSQGERLKMLIGTSEQLSSSYYISHQNEVKQKGTHDSIRFASSSGIVREQSYKLPYMPIKLGNTACEIKNIDVSTNQASDMEPLADGTLGIRFLSQFEKVIINFNQLFVEVEKK